tara:strand:- start:34 stop:228 length:195 start_codon:yes stop_codon:yes gene_type:complete
MKEQYSVDEILNAVNDLQNLTKEKKINNIITDKPISNYNSDVPSSTLKLIEEAEKTIRSKNQSE